MPVLCPFDVAKQLASDISAYRTMRMNHQGQEGEHGKTDSEKKKGAEKYLLCKVLKAMLDTPKVEISKHLTTAGKIDIRSTVAAHEKLVARLDFSAEAVAAELGQWMKRKLFQILLNGSERADEHILLQTMDTVAASLPQTGIGLNALKRLTEDAGANDFFMRFFKAGTGLGASEIKNAKKVGAVYASLLGTVIGVRTLALGHSATRVLETLDAKFGSLGAWETGSAEVRIAKVETFAAASKLEPGAPAHRSLLTEVQAISGEAKQLKKLDAFLGKANAALKFLDGINLALAVRAFFKTPKAKKALRMKRGLDALFGTIGLFSSIMNKVFDLAGRETIKLSARAGIRCAGFVAGAYTLVVASVDAHSAWSIGDYDAATAMFMSGLLGAASSALGFCAAASLAPGAGIVAAIIGIVGVLFYFLYLYLKDTPLQTFALHSQFGKEAGSGDKQPGWSPVKLGELSASLDRQVTALEMLRRQFAVTFGPKAKWKGQTSPFYAGRIVTGAIDDGTRFVVSWVWDALNGNGSVAEVWAPHAGAAKADRSFAPLLLVDADKRVYFDVPIPDRAMKDSGYGGGQYGFRELRLHVFKTYKKGSATGRLPLSGDVDLIVQDGSPAPDTSKEKLAWD